MAIGREFQTKHVVPVYFVVFIGGADMQLQDWCSGGVRFPTEKAEYVSLLIHCKYVYKIQAI